MNESNRLRARLLFVGDIHLGRRPSRLPDDLGEYGHDPAELGPAAAWRATVDAAIAGRADAVVLAGDVVESIEDRFEAYGHLAGGVSRLIDAGIPVFGVAGNHDVEALPRLAAQIPGFRLVGAGGGWERVPLPVAGGDVDLLGWSFPTRRVASDPLASLAPDDASPRPGAALIGVLHADLDAGRSDYAPVARADLARQPVDAWLLGHVHKPGDLSGDRPIGYLGSLVGLDPGEPGPRGPWWVTVDEMGRVEATQWPLAPLRWERVELDASRLDAVSCEGALDDDDLADALLALLREGLRDARARIEAQAAGGPRPRVVGCRVALVGRCAVHRALRGVLSADAPRPSESLDGVHYFVEKIEDRAGPAIDLGRIAVGSDPAALLARRLVALQAGGPEAAHLIDGAERRMAEGLARNSAFEGVEREVDREAVRLALVQSGTRALEDLLAQRDAGGAA